jgi:hypothetical protein
MRSDEMTFSVKNYYTVIDAGMDGRSIWPRKYGPYKLKSDAERVLDETLSGYGHITHTVWLVDSEGNGYQVAGPLARAPEYVIPKNHRY